LLEKSKENIVLKVKKGKKILAIGSNHTYLHVKGGTYMLRRRKPTMMNEVKE